jgi:hypothetical protein
MDLKYIWTFGFLKTQWISWPTKRLSPSEAEHCRIQLDVLIITFKKHISFNFSNMISKISVEILNTLCEV